MSVFNAYVISLSKYVNTGIVAVFTILAWLGVAVDSERVRHTISIFQKLLLTAFLINANMTIAWVVRGRNGRLICLLCAMEILFMLAFMVLYRIVHERANMLFFNNLCMLLSIGFVMITRIAYYGSWDDIAYMANEPIKQFVLAAAGLMAMLIIPFFRRFFDSLRHLWLLFAVVGIVMLGGVLLLSATTYGANITFTIAGFTFQPSEFVKILFLLMLAGILSTEVTMEKAVCATILSLIHVGILVLSTDLGSALIFFVVFLMMLFLATGRWRVIAAGAVLGSTGTLACYYLFAHFKERVLIWRDPFPKEIIENKGWQIAQSLFAISYGGPWGTGLTQGSPHSIPKVETDVLFAAICEEMGLVFSVCLLLICLNCFIRIIILSAGYSNRFFQLFTYGAAVCYIFQTFLTVGGQTKFIPLTGVTLPLVSYGGSSILSTLIMMGIVEMIFILHNERTTVFEERYEREHPLDGGLTDQMYDSDIVPDMPEDPGYYRENGSVPGIYSRDMRDDPYYGDNGMPDNFPVNGISEEGIFDD